ncbi:hypothetical protein CapIbe_009967 [Capra ibex]
MEAGRGRLQQRGTESFTRARSQPGLFLLVDGSVAESNWKCLRPLEVSAPEWLPFLLPPPVAKASHSAKLKVTGEHCLASQWEIRQSWNQQCNLPQMRQVRLVELHPAGQPRPERPGHRPRARPWPQPKGQDISHAQRRKMRHREAKELP